MTDSVGRAMVGALERRRMQGGLEQLALRMQMADESIG